MAGDIRALVVALACVVALFGCHSHRADPVPVGKDDGDALASRLRSRDETRRATVDFSAVKPWNLQAGADPIRIAALPDGAAIALLRNAASIVMLDDRAHEIQRLAAPRSPTGLAVFGGDVYVCGELSPMIARYRIENGRLRAAGALTLTGAIGLRDVAIGPERVLYVADEHDGKTFAVRASDAAWASGSGFEQRESPGKIAPFRIARVGHYVIVDDLLAHALAITRVDAHGWPTRDPAIVIQHDGPIWSFDAQETPGGLIVAAGGVEDHALDRSGGFFGFIDSFVFLYRVTGNHAERIALQNVSELGVVTPKAISLQIDASKIALLVTGYGGDHVARIHWPQADLAHPSIFTYSLSPGISAVSELTPDHFVFASALLDAFGVVAPGFTTLVAVTNGAAPRSVASRVGEALFFTVLMAPSDSSDGAHSRFTCETCHFEGYGDGRTHFTGREDVHATTKPLRGLWNNRPHFSRALDPDLPTVSLNEFRVASAGSGASEDFVVDAADFPWIRDLGVTSASLDDEDLRGALVEFLEDYSHSPNPAIIGRDHFTSGEHRGAEVFRDHCETCHEARFASDAPATRAPFETWEAAIFSENGALVWARSTYEKTGVVPYVHELGARVPSLRRLAKKRPYLTNGSALDLATIVADVRFSEHEFFHANATTGAVALPEVDQSDLVAFLNLL